MTGIAHKGTTKTLDAPPEYCYNADTIEFTL